MNLIRAHQGGVFKKTISSDNTLTYCVVTRPYLVFQDYLPCLSFRIKSLYLMSQVHLRSSSPSCLLKEKTSPSLLCGSVTPEAQTTPSSLTDPPTPPVSFHHNQIKQLKPDFQSFKTHHIIVSITHWLLFL